MNYGRQFYILGNKQLAIQEGIICLQQIQSNLLVDQGAAAAWGKVAVLANVVIIPINVILNAFDLKKANTFYQIFVRQLYGQFGTSGTRLDGRAKIFLSVLRRVVMDELKYKGLMDFVPGVNILLGLVEDSLAAWQIIQSVEQGNGEVLSQVARLSANISAANHQLIKLGVKRAEILVLLQTYARTA